MSFNLSDELILTGSISNFSLFDFLLSPTGFVVSSPLLVFFNCFERVSFALRFQKLHDDIANQQTDVISSKLSVVKLLSGSCPAIATSFVVTVVNKNVAGASESINWSGFVWTSGKDGC